MAVRTPTPTKQYYIDWIVTPTHTEIVPWYSDISVNDARDSRRLQDQDLMPIGVSAVESKDVLVVEDETYLRELIADVLESEGHTPRTAANGKEAIERIREQMPQLILLDLMMPVMNGWELMQALKDQTEWSNIPVVLITAVYDIKRTQQQVGARAVLTKPFDIEDIADIVRAHAN